MAKRLSYFYNIKPLSSIMIGVLFAVLCLVLLGGGLLVTQKFNGVSLADSIQIIIMVFIAGTMFVGYRAHNYEKSYEQSATNLASALSLLERAALVLQPGGVLTNDRIAWVTCARLITRAEALKNNITTETHRLIFEAEHDFQRHYFRDFLRQNGRDLSGAFFCGGDSSISLGMAVTNPAQPPDGASWIPERILNVVYKFIAFPDRYEDPLDTSEKFNDKERKRLRLLGYEGVKQYVDFRKEYYPVRHKIRSKNALDKTSSQSAEDIDCYLFSAQYDFDD